MTRYLAIDVGGTKLAAAVVEASGEIVRQEQTPTHPAGAGDGEALWLTLQRLVDRVLDDGLSPDGGGLPETVNGVGIGCGGPLRWPVGEVSPLNLEAWRDFPLRARLQERFPDVPVRLANDAIAMAVGEHWRGAAASWRGAAQAARAFLGVVVSTGVGGGVLVDGRVVMGKTGNAGHLGHVVVEPDGPSCRCGGRGCLEAIARGPAVVAWAHEQGWRPDPGQVADGRTLLAAARAGDLVARQAFERAGTALGVALASAAALLELELVAVGGGLANAGDLLLDPARRAFSRHGGLDFVRRCAIVPASLGTSAGLVGAAALVADGDRYWPSGAD